MRVDFYQLSEGTPESVVPLLARATLQSGQRLLVVAADEGLRSRIDTALWEQQSEAFLAHGDAGKEHAERQPILLFLQEAGICPQRPLGGGTVEQQNRRSGRQADEYYAQQQARP